MDKSDSLVGSFDVSGFMSAGPEGVAFDPIILWLGKLTRTYQIETSLITIEPQGGGRVNARLTLLEPAV